MSVHADHEEALHALLEIGRALRSGGDVQPVLEAVASAVRRATGFRTVAINLHRPAWDDFEIVVVEGNDEARRSSCTRSTRPSAGWPATRSRPRRASSPWPTPTRR